MPITTPTTGDEKTIMDYVGHLTDAGIERPQADAIVVVTAAQQQTIIKEIAELRADMAAMHAKMNMLVGGMIGIYVGLFVFFLHSVLG